MRLFSFRAKMWVVSLELASYHPSGAHNLEVAATFLENRGPLVHAGTGCNKL